MHQVYLLLRNNQQSGPYTLEQLLQLQLKPFDLVWVDGRSPAWQYPGEVPALKPYVPATPQADQPYMPVSTSVMDEAAEAVVAPQSTPPIALPQEQPAAVAAPPKKIFVSMPQRAAAQATAPVGEARPAPPPAKPVPAAQTPVQAAPIIQPQPMPVAEPQAAPSWHQAYQPSAPSTTDPVQAKAASLNSATAAATAAGGETRYARSMEEMEQSYTNWMAGHKNKKKKNISAKDLGIVAALFAIIGGGYYLLSKPALTAAHLPAAQAAVTATPVQEQPVTEPTADPSATDPQPLETQPQTVATTTGAAVNTGQHAANTTPVTVTSVPARTTSVKKTAATPVAAQTPVINTPTVTRTESAPANDPAPARTASAPAGNETRQDVQKKKKLRDVFKDIFSNKSKDKTATAPATTQPATTSRTKTAPVDDDPRPATNRQAARRSDDAPAPTTTSSTENTAALADQVDIFSNASGDWMMGVSGLKVTLRNRSASALQSAAVDVLYYDQNNKLLDRKTLNFGNVPARGRQTLAAPDNKWADHVDYKLQNVTAKDDRYARG